MLPWDFTPAAIDGEVEAFERMPVGEVARCVAYGASSAYPCLAESSNGDGTDGGGKLNAFKPNINLVVIDFLVRHGYIPPEAPGYLELVASLRQGECF